MHNYCTFPLIKFIFKQMFSSRTLCKSRLYVPKCFITKVLRERPFALRINSTGNHNGFFFLSVIEEANWLTLERDLGPLAPPQSDGSSGFDALICMGNSFAHLPDSSGDQRDQRLAIGNFYSLIRPGGILVIDHRNYDYILKHGNAPKNNIYYNVSELTKRLLRSIRTNLFISRVMGSIVDSPVPACTHYC